MSQKLPLHEVISNKLGTIIIDLTPGSTFSQSVLDYMDILVQGKMKAADAHAIAERHAGAPKLLRTLELGMLADAAEEFIRDLRSRTDEPEQEKKDQSAIRVPATLASRMPAELIPELTEEFAQDIDFGE